MRMPITCTSLRQLEIHTILQNPNIRHDLVFDSNLKFSVTPASTQAGQLKVRMDNLYWDQVSREMAGYEDDKGLYHPPNYATLPMLLAELRDILFDLLPSTAVTNKSGSQNNLILEPTSYDELQARFDTKQVLQELKHNGTYDFSSLVDYIGQKLVLHFPASARPRIQALLDMSGQEEAECSDLLRYCFELFEQLKLVSVNKVVYLFLFLFVNCKSFIQEKLNTQIKSTRPHVIQTAVKFEQRYFNNQIKQDKMKLVKTAKWMSRSMSDLEQSLQDMNCESEEPCTEPNSAQTEAAKGVNAEKVYNHGFVDLLNTPTGPNVSPMSNRLPEIFELDAGRIARFTHSLRRIHRVACVLLILQQLLGKTRCDANLLSHLHNVFWTLYGSDPTQVPIDNIVDQMIVELRTISKAPYTSEQLVSLRRFMVSSLSSTSPIYRAMRSRLFRILRDYLESPEPFCKERLAPLGLGTCETQLNAFALAIHKLATHNKNVFADILNLLYQRLSS
jgi:hypothetical protein